MVKVVSFFFNENCFAGYMLAVGHGLSTTALH